MSAPRLRVVPDGHSGPFYTEPSREDDPHALPNAEVWEEDGTQVGCDGDALAAGWYWWPCFPGCLPDGDPIGPFESREEAVADAQEDCE